MPLNYKKGIIIPTHTTRVKTWLTQCLDSIKTDFEVHVVFQGDKPSKEGEKLVNRKGFEVGHYSKNGYDPGAVVYAMTRTNLDEFFIIHDSCVVHDNKIFNHAFALEDVSVAISSYPNLFGMFLGKYRRTVASKLDLPVAKGKMHAVDLETDWNNLYCEKDMPVVFCPDFIDRNGKVEEKFSRKNLVISNKYLTKYKGSWHRTMILE